MTTSGLHPASLRPGEHVMWIFHSEPERRDRLVSWVEEGFASREQVVYIEPSGDGGVHSRLPDLLRDAGLDPEGASERGELLLLSPEAVHPPDAPTGLASGIEWFESIVQGALRRGLSGVRLGDEPARAVPTLGRHGLLRMERALESSLPALPASSLCLYRAEHVDPDLLRSLAASHSRRLGDPFMEVIRQQASLHLSGELDISNLELLEVALGEAMKVSGRLHLDLRHLRFMDASGLGLLARTADEVERLAVARPMPQVARLFHLMGLAHLLEEEQR